jgi:hypothetical protein
MRVVDIETASTLLRDKLRLPTWAASVSPAEVDGRDAIVVRLEQRQAHRLHGLPFPQSFEGYPVVVEIRPIDRPN